MLDSEQRPFNPEMLILRREALGWTQTALAGRLGVSPAKLSKIEAALRSPSAGLVQKMATKLHRPVPFFYSRDQVYGPGVSEFFHKKRQAVGVKALRQAHAQINEELIVIRRLLRSVELDDRFSALADLEDMTAVEAARAVRSIWNLPTGPIRSVVSTLEDAGAILIECTFPASKIFAISRWIPGLPPTFFVRDDAPTDLLRSALCHELGHLLLHRDAPNPDMEREADQFQAELLMPAKDISHDLYNLNIEKLAALKPYWKVSMRNLLYRAEALGKISPRKARHLWMRLGQLGYRRREPEELAIPPERPSLMDELFKVHRELGFSLSDLGRTLLMHDDEICSRYGVERDSALDERPRFRLVR